MRYRAIIEHVNEREIDVDKLMQLGGSMGGGKLFCSQEIGVQHLGRYQGERMHYGTPQHEEKGKRKRGGKGREDITIWDLVNYM